MIRTRSGGTLKSRQMSRRDDSDTVISGPARLASCLATRACIRTKPYQRRLDSRSNERWLRPGSDAKSIRLSTLIGWWMLVTSGRPYRPRFSMA